MESLAQSEHTPEYDLEDYTEEEYYSLLCRLPRELALRHLSHIISNDLDTGSAIHYLENIIQGRHEAVTETVISDSHAKELLESQEAEFLREIETTVFTDPKNLLGSGLTARVKSFAVSNEEESIPMAVKYLVTPTSKTLSAAAEHDMIREVERIKQIEEIERDAHFKFIGVPHPYFHHKTAKIQCYGMQLIDGPDLEIASEQITNAEMDTETLNLLSNLNLEEIFSEIDALYQKMHTYCLHGDMKPKNLMLDTSGKFYIIDFGQSILSIDISEEAADQFDNLKEDEVNITKDIIRSLSLKAKRALAHTST
jgi:tRNA A-37 threonylcarbamoyl transferase component Bud32